MREEDVIELRQKLGGHTFAVEEDPDNPTYFSVYADKDGSGCEVAGKIGEPCVALAIAESLRTMCGCVGGDRDILDQRRLWARLRSGVLG